MKFYEYIILQATYIVLYNRDLSYSFVQNSFVYRKQTYNGGGLKSTIGNIDDALESRTCILNFLTQRSVQSFMFLQKECRDVHTVSWLEDFSNTTNMLLFHGTGAFDTTRYPNWDSMFVEMMDRPAKEIVVRVEARVMISGGSLSKNRKVNPYLKKPVREYIIDIDPTSIASRIISVREQIAKEFAEDIEIIENHGEYILESYFDNMIKDRDEDAAVETNLDSVSNEDQVNKCPFDRYKLTMLLDLKDSDSIQRPSPLRKGSFDLLLLLITQESIHRVLKNLFDYGSSESMTHFHWLIDFYSQRIPLYFDGNGKYGRSYDFFQDLLLASPEVHQKKTFIDPLGLAEKIIRKRTLVASEWKQTLHNVPLHHVDLRKKLLTRQMQKVDTTEESSMDPNVSDQSIAPATYELQQDDDTFSEFQ